MASRVVANTFRQRLINNSNSVTTKITTIKNRFQGGINLPEKYKGKYIEKVFLYWKGLIRDYGDVFSDVGQTMIDKPRKAWTYATIIGGAYLCGRNNPTDIDFIEQLRDYTNGMALVAEHCHNPKSREFLDIIEKGQNEGVLRRSTIGIATIVWLDNYDSDAALYKANCSFLKPEWLKFHERIIDVGFLGNHWNLWSKMRDFDVNPASL